MHVCIHTYILQGWVKHFSACKALFLMCFQELDILKYLCSSSKSDHIRFWRQAQVLQISQQLYMLWQNCLYCSVHLRCLIWFWACYKNVKILMKCLVYNKGIFTNIFGGISDIIRTYSWFWVKWCNCIVFVYLSCSRLSFSSETKILVGRRYRDTLTMPIGLRYTCTCLYICMCVCMYVCVY